MITTTLIFIVISAAFSFFTIAIVASVIVVLFIACRYSFLLQLVTKVGISHVILSLSILIVHHQLFETLTFLIKSWIPQAIKNKWLV